MSDIVNAIMGIESAISDLDLSVDTSEVYNGLMEIVNVIETTNISLASIADSLVKLANKR